MDHFVLTVFLVQHVGIAKDQTRTALSGTQNAPPLSSASAQGGDEMSLFVTVVIFDDETGIVEEEVVLSHSGAYGFEVVRAFEMLGNKIAKKVDESYEP